MIPRWTRPSHPLYNTDREIEALGPRWKETFRYKDAVVMVQA
jgi:hypothetical protein